jgi:porin
MGTLAWVLLVAVSGQSEPAVVFEPADAWLDGMLERQRLTGSWRGLRSRLEGRGVDFEIVYTGDVFANVRGGVERGSVYLDNYDLSVTCRLEELIGHDLGTVFVYALANQGGKPSDDAGDLQMLDDIQAPSTAKLYEAWWQTTYFERTSLLVGLYDLNSEFYTLDGAAVFVNSSFGIGADLGTSGRNGPSIFPTTSLGARLRMEPLDGLTFKLAVLDGVPGDPDNFYGTHIRLSSGDGVLVAAEAAYVKEVQTDEAADVRRVRRRRVGRGYGPLRYHFKLALGAWYFSTPLPALGRTQPDGSPATARGRPGVYLVADWDATRWDPLRANSLSVFVQTGLADGDVGRVAGYVGAGLSYRGLLPWRPQDELGLGIATALLGDGERRVVRGQGQRPSTAEIALEFTYRVALTPWLSFQPDLQYIVSPGGRAERSNALALGLRWEVAF